MIIREAVEHAILRVWFLLVIVFFLGISFSLVMLMVLMGCCILIVHKKESYPETLTGISCLKPGDIILTGQRSIDSSWHIQLANVLTRNPRHRFWTHAAIYIGGGRLIEAQQQGIIERDISVYFQEGVYLRALRHKYLQDPGIVDELVRFCVNKKGANYDMWGAAFYALSIMIPMGFDFMFDDESIDEAFHLENAYFCSELVVDAFASVHYPVSACDGWRVKPLDFVGSPVLEDVLNTPA